MSGDLPQSSGLEREIRAELIDILFRHAPLMQVTNLVISSSLVWYLWSLENHGLLLGWWTVNTLLGVYRIGLVLARRMQLTGHATPSWARLMTAATAVSGALWGIAGWMFFDPDSGPALVFLTIILAGMTGGSTVSHSSWPRAQMVYAIGTMLPLSLRFLLSEDKLWVLGLMCLIYLTVMISYSRQLYVTLVTSIRLRLEKQELVLQLSKEKLAAEDARSQAESANAAKTRFLAAASHDLRQPLHAINLLTEALRLEQDPARSRSIVENLVASTEALDELLDSLLDISKLDAGLFEPQMSVIEMQEMFNALRRDLLPLAEQKGIELGFVATRLKVRSDPRLLGRVLRNIITNAIRYTDEGAVLVGCRRAGTHLRIAIHDTGAGIAPEFHQLIFQEFYQLHNPERDRTKGLGLGLAIVQRLCTLLGHTVTLQSIVGAGSTFSVVLPRADASETAPVKARTSNQTDLHGRAVLVIDDEIAVRQAMTEVLQRWGCRVLTAESSVDAVARLQEEDFAVEVIVADFRLREERTGADAIQAVRQHLAREVPAMIVTGDTAPERLREASALGYALLHKPIQPVRLRAVLITLLGLPCASAVSEAGTVN